MLIEIIFYPKSSIVKFKIVFKVRYIAKKKNEVERERERERERESMFLSLLTLLLF